MRKRTQTNQSNSAVKRIEKLIKAREQVPAFMYQGAVSNNNLFALIAFDKKAEQKKIRPYAVYSYDPEKDRLTCRDIDLTFAYALIRMGEVLNE